ncbi:MAG: hypothetical protein J6K13_09390 [Clostridia bacterium]|nr:hypothetical protein [Clostridia bacterium]
MKQKKKFTNNDEFNFWQPASDMFSALLLILMLVIILMGLYLVHVPDEELVDTEIGDVTSSPTPSPTPLWAYDGGDGGTYATPSPTPTVSPTPSPTPTPVHPGYGGGGGDDSHGEGDPGAKSAVYVMMVDAETNRTIKEAGVEFELYGENNALQILNVYYPELLSHRIYATTDAGTFFFPEKLAQGHYEIRQVTTPAGYDPAEDVAFYLGKEYDWPEPLVVRIPVFAARNVIRVQMTDAETGMPVSGGSFDIIAGEDILTADGTMRHYAGQLVGTLACDEDGYGESKELYLGSYILRQKEIPDHYAGLTEEIEVTVAQKTDALPTLNTVASRRTRIRLNLTDELYNTRGISGATFLISAVPGGEPVSYTTDSSGRILLDELDKGVTYRILQTASTTGYRYNQDETHVSVDLNGYIGEETEATVNLTNRMLRASIGITDEFSSVQVPNVSLALYNAQDELIRTWTTTGSALMFNELEEGRYYLIKDGDTETRYDIRIANQAEVQVINIHTTYVMQYVMFGFLAVFIIAMAIAIPSYIRKRRKK